MIRDAVVMLIDNAGRFVAIRRASGIARPGYWSPPTGKLEAGEAQEEAVRREAREEVGLAVEPVEKIWECITDDGLWRLHWWLATTPQRAFVPDPAEVAEARWVTTAQFLRLAPLFDKHREFFTGVGAGRWD